MKRNYEFGIVTADADAAKVNELLTMIHMNISPMFIVISDVDDLATGTIMSCEDFAAKQPVLEIDPEVAIYVVTGMEAVKIKSMRGRVNTPTYITNLSSFDFINTITEEYRQKRLRVSWTDPEKNWDED